MNVLNRLVMIVIALLLIVVPVILLLVAFGVISASLINQYTNYQGGLQFLQGISLSSFTNNILTIIGIIGIVLAILAFIFLILELRFSLNTARSTLVDDTPGRETTITPKAVNNLIEAKARETGAASPSISLKSEGRPYKVWCDIEAPDNSNRTELATRTRENIQQTLQEQKVPVNDVEVTVRGTARREGG